MSGISLGLQISVSQRKLGTLHAECRHCCVHMLTAVVAFHLHMGASRIGCMAES